MFGDVFVLMAALFLGGPLVIGYVATRVARRCESAEPARQTASAPPRLSIAAFASGLLWLAAFPVLLVVRDTHTWLIYAGWLPGPPGKAAPIMVAIGVTVLGFALGLTSLYRITQRPRQLRGQGYAWVGLVLCWSVGLYLTVHPLPRARMNDHMERLCGRNVAWLAGGVYAYAKDHDGRFPSADSWMEVIGPYLGDEEGLRSSPQLCGYAYNAALGEKRLTDLAHPASVIAVFETPRHHAEDGSWIMPGGGQQLLPDNPSHVKGDYYGFANGRHRWLPRRKLADGAWAKEPDADWVRWEP